MKLKTKTMSVVAALATVSAAIAIGGAAFAAGTSISLEAKGEYAKLHRSACGKHKAFRAFHRNSRIEFRGVLTPHPARHFLVRVKVERCERGHWRKVADYRIVGKKLTGKFKRFVRATPLAPRRRHHRTTFYYYKAKAVYQAAHSREAYFTVRS